jgi:hypothetical protein
MYWLELKICWATLFWSLFHKPIWSPWKPYLRIVTIWPCNLKTTAAASSWNRPQNILLLFRERSHVVINKTWPRKDESLKSRSLQGCQMVYFKAKNHNLGKFWSGLYWKILIYFRAIWNILQAFGILYDHLVHFVFIRYLFPVLVLCTKKSLATPGRRSRRIKNAFFGESGVA